jgi:hypothetical protein
VTIQEPDGSTVRRFFGAALIAVGVLMIAFAGMCSAVSLWLLLAFMGQGHTAGPGDFLGVLGIVALFGVPPIIVGYVLYRIGRGLRRRGPNTPAEFS